MSTGKRLAVDCYVMRSPGGKKLHAVDSNDITTSLCNRPVAGWTLEPSKAADCKTCKAAIK